MSRSSPASSISLRLRRLQRLLSVADDQTPCVLALTGVDAHFNVGSSQLAKWLFNGNSCHRVLELDPNPLELEDVVMLVTSSSIHLAIERKVWDAIREEVLAYSSNVYVYPWEMPDSPTARDYELLTMHKAHALGQMLEGICRLSVALPAEWCEGQLCAEMAHTVNSWQLLMQHQHLSGAHGQPFTSRYQVGQPFARASWLLPVNVIHLHTDFQLHNVCSSS